MICDCDSFEVEILLNGVKLESSSVGNFNQDDCGFVFHNLEVHNLLYAVHLQKKKKKTKIYCRELENHDGMGVFGGVERWEGWKRRMEKRKENELLSVLSREEKWENHDPQQVSIVLSQSYVP